ncbi:MAG TPA: saccharopine dehydrogenase NADP-binding domain-containing protein [Chloroflexota bacterium]|nr:saccharopine dehydrogenase NADP-binding domain-containing protein [Chloroflexota bacterium]
MAVSDRVLIAGGYGVFGRVLARELLSTTQVDLVLAGRDLRRAEKACRELGAGERASALRLDLSEPRSLEQGTAGCFAVACTAGPFQSLHPGLPAAAVRAGAHWLDIADLPGWVMRVLADTALGAAASVAELAVMPGLSSTPTLATVLIDWCRDRVPGASGARLTLFIGNRNPKGPAAIASALSALSAHPQAVDLPVGRRIAYRFDYPGAETIWGDLGAAMEFRVAFESRLAGRVMASASPFARRLKASERARLARWLAIVAAPASRFGSNVGCLQVELWDGAGSSARAALVGRGQRLAILPCALAIEALLSAEPRPRGLVKPAGWLTTQEWLSRLQARGVEFRSHVSSPS